MKSHRWKPEPKRRNDEHQKSKIYGYADLIENSNIKAITLEALKQYERLFFIYPAGQRLHHNYVGGLAHHTLGMLEIAQDFKRNFPYLEALTLNTFMPLVFPSFIALISIFDAIFCLL